MTRERERAERAWRNMAKPRLKAGDFFIVELAQIAPKRKPQGNTYYAKTPYIPPSLRPRRQKILAWRSWEHVETSSLARAA